MLLIEGFKEIDRNEVLVMKIKPENLVEVYENIHPGWKVRFFIK